MIESPVARMRYDAKANRWSLQYRNRNLRWQSYQWLATGSFEELLEEIDRDPTGILWG